MFKGATEIDMLSSHIVLKTNVTSKFIGFPDFRSMMSQNAPMYDTFKHMIEKEWKILGNLSL